MAKLTGAKKKAFLERMAKGRKKAGRANPKRKSAPKRKAAKKKSPARKKPAAKKRPAPKKGGRKNPGALRGAKKLAFLERMAKGRRKAKRTGNGAKKKRRGRNPDDMTAAERKFEEFHQKPASRVVEYDEQYKYPENFAEMGKLVELRFALDAANPDFPLTKFGQAQAVTTPDGANIYFIGGDQSVDLSALGIASDKDFVELGACTYIAYHTVKGFHDFSPTTYWHRFGEEDDILPGLVYDRLNQRLFLTSGNYRVKPEGIVN